MMFRRALLAAPLAMALACGASSSADPTSADGGGPTGNGGTDGGSGGRETDQDSVDGANEDGSAIGDASSDVLQDVAPGGTKSCTQAFSATPTRGAQWTRTQPMFVSALTVGMPAPSTSDVNDYFDAFGATSVHTWATGLPTRVAGWRAANHAAFRYVSWVDKDGKSLENGQLLGGVGAASNGRIGFQIGDEPASDADLDTMLTAASSVRAVDPDALVILNFAANASADGFMTRAAAHADVDVLSVDQYTYKDSTYATLASVRSHALAAHKVYWRYTDAYTENGDPSPSESDMRWDAMVGLVYGFTGLTWFIYQVDSGGTLASELFSATGTFSAAKTPRYTWASAINREVQSLGSALTQLESTDVRYVAGTSFLQPKGTTAFAAGAGGNPYLVSVATSNALDDVHLGFFRDACGEPYVLVLNPAHAQGKFPLSMEHTITVTLGFDFSKSTDPSLDESAVDALDAKDGIVKGRALTSTGAHEAKLDITLAPGNVFFFKPHDAYKFAAH